MSEREKWINEAREFVKRSAPSPEVEDILIVALGALVEQPVLQAKLEARGMGLFNPFCDAVTVAEVSLTDDLAHDVATLEPGFAYGVEVLGGQSVAVSTAARRVRPGDAEMNCNMGRVWLAVERPCVLSACKPVRGIADAVVRVLRKVTP